MPHRRFLRGLDKLTGMGSGDEMLADRIALSREIATSNFDFFTSLAALSANAPLRGALETAQHVVRLGSLSLPDWVDVAGLGRVQAGLLEALQAGDREASHAAIAMLRELAVPGAAATRDR